MRPVSRYSLRRSNHANRTSLLTRDGTAQAVEVDGSILEAQFQLSDGSALISLTDDSPYDEGLHIYLLSKQDMVEDALEGGADFSPGILKIRQTGEDWVEFEFFTSGTVYRLEVTNTAKLRFSLPAGWKYKKRLSRHRLVIHEASKGGADVGSKT